MKKVTRAQNYSSLITDLASLIEQGRKTAVRYVNTALVGTYWLMGRRIVEYEQKGKERAEYGEALMERISKDLSPRFGKGFSERNLELMRKLYLTYPISQTLSVKSLSAEKTQTPSAESVMKSQTTSGKLKKGYTLCSELESKQKDHPLSIPSDIRHTLCAELKPIF